jgi:hypothetical protein
MWQKLKEQLPVIFVTAVLVIGAAVYILRDLAVRQQADVAPLRLENEYLPANLVIDAANLNFVSGDKTKALEVSRKIEELEKRLKEVQSLAGTSGS